jgi:hypothetical protein
MKDFFALWVFLVMGVSHVSHADPVICDTSGKQAFRVAFNQIPPDIIKHGDDYILSQIGEKNYQINQGSYGKRGVWEVKTPPTTRYFLYYYYMPLLALGAAPNTTLSVCGDTVPAMNGILRVMIDEKGKILPPLVRPWEKPVVTKEQARAIAFQAFETNIRDGKERNPTELLGYEITFKPADNSSRWVWTFKVASQCKSDTPLNGCAEYGCVEVDAVTKAVGKYVTCPQN